MRTLLLLTTCICLSAVTRGFQDPQGQGIFTIGTNPAGPSAVTGTCNVPADGTTADVLSRIIATLAPGGGEIIMLPGTYLFDRPLTVDVDNITIRGSWGTVLAPDPAAPSLPTIFDVTGSGFRLVGLTIEETTVPNEERSWLSVSGSELSVRDCVFRIPDLAELPGPRYTFIDINPGAMPNRKGFYVAHNAFVFGHLGVAAQPEWYGIAALQARDVQILTNTFRGGNSTNFGYCGSCILLEQSQHAIVSGNILKSLGSSGGVSARAIVDVTAGSSNVILSGNTLEDCVAPYAFHLAADNLTLVGNHIGSRGVGAPIDGYGAVHLDSASGASIYGNSFHGMGREDSGTPYPAILIENGTASAIIGNRFTGCDFPQVSTTDAEDVQVSTNQFLTHSDTTGTVHAIAITGGNRHLVVSNSALGGGWDAPFWTITLSTIYATHNNWP